MYSRKVLDQERSLEELYHKLDTVVKTSHPEPPEAVCYWQKKKRDQISYLKFHTTSICEEGQHVKPCQKAGTYQVLPTA